MTRRADNRDENAKEPDSSITLPEQPQSSVEFLPQSTLMGLDIDVGRDKSSCREIDSWLGWGGY